VPTGLESSCYWAGYPARSETLKSTPGSPYARALEGSKEEKKRKQGTGKESKVDPSFLEV